MGGGAWWATVHEVAKSQTRLSDFPFTFHFDALEKEMATHSVILPGEIHGQKTLTGYSSWDHKDPNTIGQLYNKNYLYPGALF